MNDGLSFACRYASAASHPDDGAWTAGGAAAGGAGAPVVVVGDSVVVVGGSVVVVVVGSCRAAAIEGRRFFEKDCDPARAVKRMPGPAARPTRAIPLTVTATARSPATLTTQSEIGETRRLLKTHGAGLPGLGEGAGQPLFARSAPYTHGVDSEASHGLLLMRSCSASCNCLAALWFPANRGATPHSRIYRWTPNQRSVAYMSEARTAGSCPASNLDRSSPTGPADVNSERDGGPAERPPVASIWRPRPPTWVARRSYRWAPALSAGQVRVSRRCPRDRVPWRPRQDSNLRPRH